MAYESEKEAAALKAVSLIKNGMKIGIGTGSSAAIFIKILKERILREKLSISCVCTSFRSQNLLENVIPLLSESLIDKLDYTFDGADRADPSTFFLIKGGGGALLREKLVAKCTKVNIVLIDPSKISTPLGGFPVAIEIVKFGFASTIKKIESLGYRGKLRDDPTGKPALSDNDNYIYDITFDGPILDPEKHHISLKQTLGVIETGFFLDTATFIYQGNKDGTVKILEKP